jgi:hypothetical protein
MDGNFAELVDEAARRRGLNDYQLAHAIGLLSGNRVFSSKQVNRLRTGRQRHHDDRELIARLIKVLHLTEEEADEFWLAANQRPPDLDLEGYRRFRQEMADVGAASVQGDPKNGRFQDFPAWRRGSDRRRRDRRHLHLVPQAERVPA